MSNNVAGSENVTPRTSNFSPTWGPPKAPLSPRRLAKLANALGVSTPVIPLTRNLTSASSRSFLDPFSQADHLRRSPSPSASSTFSAYPPTTSKFLLHVIPPLHLPHDSDDDDDSGKAPPPNAPGYHKQFRRGTLVPVHSTLQAQLGAIAREYALPSSTGLILYLINSSPQSPLPPSPEGEDEPGPRLSDEVWKHLWARVLRAERKDDIFLPSASITPLTPGTPIIEYDSPSRSTPFLPQENALRPFMVSPSGDAPLLPLAPRPSYPTHTAPSTPSSTSDLRSNSKSAPPSSIASSEPGTPDTSIDDQAGLRVNSIDLPGLNSPSLIPILAKVEFDIDKRKATWYNPWLRSRQANHAKRFRNGSRNDESVAPLELLTVRKSERKKKDPLGLSLEADETMGYVRITDSPVEIDDEDLDGDEDETAKFSILARGDDPLADLFGLDADTWADISAEAREHKRKYVNSNIVNLVLTAEELTSLPDLRDVEDDTESTSTKEEEEVLEMLEKMSNPTGRKVLPPLTIRTKERPDILVVPRPSNTMNTDLAYMEPDQSSAAISSQREVVKREFAVFDDLDLGLDPSEFDENDLNDRRRSQLIMSRKLDEIERTMAQLSPRVIPSELEERNSLNLSPSSPRHRELLPPRSFDGARLPQSSPRLPQHLDLIESPTEDTAAKSWPAIPFSMIKDKMGQSENPNAPSPPRLAVNGVTTSAPKPFSQTRVLQNGLTETEKRRKELEEEHGVFLPERTESLAIDSVVIPLSPDPFNRYPSSPIEPPQPQPVPVSVERGPEAKEVVETRPRSGTTSRFSADSLTGAEPAVKNNNRTTLMSVRSIKNLWRKSKEKNVPSGSVSDVPPPTPIIPSSGKALPSVPPQRPERPSEEQLYPDTDVNPSDNMSRLSPQLIPPPQPQRSSIDQGGRRTPQDQMRPPPAPRSSLDQMGPPQLSIPMYQGRNPNAGPVTTVHMRQTSRSTPHLDRLRFDQESPYPIRVSPLPRSSRPPSPPLPTVPEQERHVAPKSILKWRNGPNGSSHHVPSGSTHEAPVVPRQSFERPSANPSGRGRRPSVINFGSTRATTSDLPPSPPIPTQYIPVTAKGSGFKVVNPSRESPTPPAQRQASLDSQSSRPSIDVSQFEFVSPRISP